MAKKRLITYEQLNTLSKGIYAKLHGEVEIVATGVNTTNGNVTALTTRVTAAEGKLDTINGDGAGSIAKALQDAKDYADGQDTKLHTTITGEIDTAKAALQGDIDKKAAKADMTTALAAKADAADLTTEVNRAKKAEKGLADRLDVIEGEDTVEGSIKKALKDAKDDAAGKYATNGALSTISEKVTTAEGNIDALKTAVGTDEKGNLKSVASQISDVNTAAEELAGRVTANETAIGNIQKDYLKAADKTELSGKITEAKEAADAAQGTANDAKTKIDTFMKAADVKEGAIDTLKEIQDYITSDGAAAKKMTSDIAARVKQTDYDTKVQKLEAADSALANRATALEGLVGKEAGKETEATGLVKKVADNASGVSDNKAAIASLQKAIGTVTEVASSTAVKAVEDRVQKTEDAIGVKAAGEKPATGLYKEIADEATRAKGVENGLRTDVNALKTTVGTSAKGLVKDVSDLQTTVNTLKGSNHTHDNKAELDKFVDGDKAALDDAVAKVTGDASVAGTIAEAKKAGDDAKAAVTGLTITATDVAAKDGTVTGVTIALGNGKTAQIDYPYEIVADSEIQAIINDLAKK